MARRKKWWAVGIFNYSLSVQIKYFLALFCMIIAIKVIGNTQFIPLQLDRMFFTSIGIILVFLFLFWRFSVEAKKEYEEKNLG